MHKLRAGLDILITNWAIASSCPFRWKSSPLSQTSAATTQTGFFILYWAEHGGLVGRLIGLGNWVGCGCRGRLLCLLFVESEFDWVCRWPGSQVVHAGLQALFEAKEIWWHICKRHTYNCNTYFEENKKFFFWIKKPHLNILALNWWTVNSCNWLYNLSPGS